MTLHTWTTEEVDGGYVGTGDFFKCRVCGAAGGPVLAGTVPRWKPFLAGTGLRLSDDCLEAQQQIRDHIRQQCRTLREKTTAPERYYWSLIYDVIGWTPEILDVTPVLDLMSRILYYRAYGLQDRPPFWEVRKTLKGLGYCLMPEDLGQALKELGEALNREPPEDP